MIIAEIPASTIVVVVIVVLGILAILSVLGSLYRKVGPNRALIVYGRGGTKVVVGGGAVVLPLFQSSQEFSLELLSFDIVPRADLYTSQGIPVKIEAVTQLKVENEEEKMKEGPRTSSSRKSRRSAKGLSAGHGGAPPRHRGSANGRATGEGARNGVAADATPWPPTWTNWVSRWCRSPSRT